MRANIPILAGIAVVTATLVVAILRSCDSPRLIVHTNSPPFPLPVSCPRRNSSSASPAPGIAFVIAVHNSRTVEFLGRLLETMWRPQDIIIVHVDAKAPPAVWATVRSAKRIGEENVHVVSFRDVVYPLNEMVETSIDMLQFAFAKACWSHVIQLSGDSYPLQKPSVIRALVEGQPDKIWMQTFSVEWKNARVFSCHKDERHMLIRPRDVRHGNSHWIFTRDFVQYILTSQAARNLLTWADCGRYQDEWVLQTLFHLSPFYSDADPRVMFAVWQGVAGLDKDMMEWMERNKKRVIDAPPKPRGKRLGSNPLTLENIELPYRGGYLFARKLTNAKVADQIEEMWSSELPTPYMKDGKIVFDG